MTIREICALPNGPRKKFYLIKLYGPLLRKAAQRDLRELGCDELCRILLGDAKKGA